MRSPQASRLRSSDRNHSGAEEELAESRRGLGQSRIRFIVRIGLPVVLLVALFLPSQAIAAKKLKPGTFKGELHSRDSRKGKKNNFVFKLNKRKQIKVLKVNNLDLWCEETFLSLGTWWNPLGKNFYKFPKTLKVNKKGKFKGSGRQENDARPPFTEIPAPHNTYFGEVFLGVTGRIFMEGKEADGTFRLTPSKNELNTGIDSHEDWFCSNDVAAFGFQINPPKAINPQGIWEAERVKRKKIG